jgi:hypothetical protein
MTFGTDWGWGADTESSRAVQRLAPQLPARLDAASAVPPPYPYSFFTPAMQTMIAGANTVDDKHYLFASSAVKSRSPSMPYEPAAAVYASAEDPWVWKITGRLCG